MYAPNKIKVEQTKDAAAKEFEAFAGEVRMFRSLACYFWSFFAFTCVYILSGAVSWMLKQVNSLLFHSRSEAMAISPISILSDPRSAIEQVGWFMLFVISQMGVFFLQHAISTAVSYVRPEHRLVVVSRRMLFLFGVPVLMLSANAPFLLSYLTLDSESQDTTDIGPRGLYFLRLIKQCPGAIRDYQCVDEQALVLSLFHFAHGILLASQFLWRKRFVLAFPRIQQSRWSRFRSTVPECVAEALWSSTSYTATFFAVTFFALSSVSYTIATMASLAFGRPVYLHPLYWSLSRLSRIGYAPLAGQLLLSAFVSGLCFEIGRVIIQIIFTQAQPLERHLARTFGAGMKESRALAHYNATHPSSGRLLLSALSQHNLQGMKGQSCPLMEKLAFLDLSMLARYSASRRSAFFREDRLNEWNTLLDVCCSHIDGLTTELIAASKEGRLNDGLRDRVGRWIQSTAGYDLLMSLTAGGLRNSSMSPWRSAPPGGARTELLLRHHDNIKWAANALTDLICASRQEDEVGIVQTAQSLQRTLNSLVGCLLAIEKYSMSLPFPSSTLSSAGYTVTSPSAQSISYCMAINFRRLSITFYSVIERLGFPPEYRAMAEKLINFEQY